MLPTTHPTCSWMSPSRLLCSALPPRMRHWPSVAHVSPTPTQLPLLPRCGLLLLCSRPVVPPVRPFVVRHPEFFLFFPLLLWQKMTFQVILSGSRGPLLPPSIRLCRPLLPSPPPQSPPPPPPPPPLLPPPPHPPPPLQPPIFECYPSARYPFPSTAARGPAYIPGYPITREARGHVFAAV